MSPRKLSTVETKRPGVPNDRSPKARKRPVVVPKVERSLVEIVSSPDEDEDEGIPVFSLDGEIYYMPSVVPASIVLETLDRLRTQTEEAVIGWMIEEVLGTEAYTALKGARGMKVEQLSAIMGHVQEHVMGALEDVQGN